jgi:hypothetical protein
MECDVVYWKDGRYIIIDKSTGEILDDAQGYGYKDKQRAIKAMWWKFKNGKEKVDNNKKLFKEWIKIDDNKRIYKEIEDILLINFKEIIRGEIKVSDIINEIESRDGVIIPKYVIKEFSK